MMTWSSFEMVRLSLRDSHPPPWTPIQKCFLWGSLLLSEQLQAYRTYGVCSG